MIKMKSNGEENRDFSSDPLKKPALSSVVRIEEKPKVAINKDKVCPFLLRIFYGYGSHHNAYDLQKGHAKSSEIQMHTWMDVTLEDILGRLIFEVKPSQKAGTAFNFQIVSYVENKLKARDIGTLVLGEKNMGWQSSLSDLKYEIGDYIDVSITCPPHNKRLRM